MPASSAPGSQGARWGVVVPVKPLAQAKSRLAGCSQRQDLALAFAQDVVAALLACPAVAQVLVVTDDDRAARALAGLGARVEPDPAGAGLNGALRAGAAALRRFDDRLGVASLPADLPAVRAEHLAAALANVPPAGRAFVADAAGRGTTLLAAAAGVALAPAYGGSSRARHLASGAVELDAPDGLRQDVDTPQDLARAGELGVGPRTAAVLSRPS